MLTMSESQPRSQSPPSRKRPRRNYLNSTFRVCTVNDFTVRQKQNQAKQKGSQSTTACQACRLRKVKCLPITKPTEHNCDAPSKCQPCHRADLDCQWDSDEQHKRRKGTKESSSSKNQDPLSSQHSTVHPIASHQDTAVHRDIAEGSTYNNNSDEDIIPVAFSNGMISRSPQIATGVPEMEAEQPIFEEIRPDDFTDLPEGLFDLQDSIFDWALAEDGSTGDLSGLILDTSQNNLEVSPKQKPRIVRVRYYRRRGPTGVLPGLRRLVLVIDPSEEERLSSGGNDRETPHATSSFLAQAPTSSPSSVGYATSGLFDEKLEQPRPDLMPLILDIFFGNFAGHFPSLNRDVLDTHIRSKVASSFLLNAIAALTLRFCPPEGPLESLKEKSDTPWRYGRPFLEKAKEQLASLLSVPEPEVATGLALLSWAEFGDNNEAGLWMFAGMSIRMVQDLGFHRTPETDSDLNLTLHDHAWPEGDGTYSLTHEQSFLHQQKARLVMFWSVFILDVCVSLFTGRPPTLRRNEIQIPLPSFKDMKMAQLDFEKEVTGKNMIFPIASELMVQFSEAVELLNHTPQTEDQDELNSEAASSRLKRLAEVRESIIARYNKLPNALVFSVANLKELSKSGQSGLFVMMHLFFFTIISLLSSTPSRESRHVLHHSQVAGSSTCATHSNRHNNGESQSDIAMVACQKLVQISMTATAVDRLSYLTSPFTSHCFFVAASTLLDAAGSSGSDADGVPACGDNSLLFALTADADYESLHGALKDQATYFSGIRSVVTFLERKKQALAQNGECNVESGVENFSAEDEVRTVSILDDAGLVNRYSISA